MFHSTDSLFSMYFILDSFIVMSSSSLVFSSIISNLLLLQNSTNPEYFSSQTLYFSSPDIQYKFSMSCSIMFMFSSIFLNIWSL